MNIEALTLKNIKLFRNITINFTNSSGKTRNWTAIIAPNGMCKTTILQSIALAASGASLSRKLLKQADEFRTFGNEDTASIEAKFSKIKPDQKTINVKLEMPKGWYSFKNGQDQDSELLEEARGKRERGYFVVGYGVGRVLPQREERGSIEDFISDRVEGLFDTRHKLLGVDFYSALEKADTSKTKYWQLEYSKTLQEALLASDPKTGERLLPWLSQFILTGKGGVQSMDTLLRSRRFELNIDNKQYKLAPTSLSQGYQSIIAWISDLLGHAFLENGRPVKCHLIEGIALIDEIDLHLHPEWQRRIIPILKHLFPKMQFIVTTHSPLILTGLESDEIIELEFEDGSIVPRENTINPGLLSGSALYQEFFNIPRAGRLSLLKDQDRLLELRAKEERSPGEEKELTSLERELIKYPSH